MMRLARLSWIGALCILVACLMVGCGSGSGTSFTTPPVTQTITANGGTLVAGNASLSVPANVVSSSTLFSIQPTNTYPADTRVVAQTAYIFTSSASSFTSSMQISIRYNAALLTTGMVEANLKLFQVVSGTWTQVSGSTVDSVNKIVKGTVTSLGTFAILATSTTTTPTTGTTLLWLSDTGGLVDVDGNRALLLFTGKIGSSTSVEISTYGGASTGLGTETIKHAAISPDGTQVVYDSRSSSGNQIVIAKIDGTGVSSILNAGLLPTNTLATPRVPSFSTDGTKVVFVYNISGADQIYTVKTDGTGLTKLTSLTTTSTVDNPAFTKAGNIRFTTTTSTGTTTYNLMASDGTGLTTVSTFQPEVAPWYTYSPDGKKIAYIAQSSGKYDVFLMNSDGSTPTQLTKLGAYAMGRARFSSDSTQVIFDAATSSTALRALYSVNIDGTSTQTFSVTTGSTVDNYLADTH